MTAPSPVTGFDHALVGVADLEAARRDWARLGFTLCPRGRHIGWGTANYCLMFADDYIELLGVVDPTQFTNNLDQRLAERGEGLMGMALAGADPAATHAALAHAGAREPQALKRLLELPGGDVVPEFSLVHLPPAATPGLPAFVCHHLTPHLMRRPEWLRHANGATGLASVTVRVPDPAAAAAAYAATFGAAAVDGTRVRLGRHTIDLISGDLGAGDGGPAALAVRVADLAEAAEWLAAERIDFTETAAGLRLDPARATGVDLTLVP
ncbi:MAG: VOC family protein [Hyphomicrobiales bacterium]|nr:VOC family protein [Hyphomicrobiales bacterium]